MNKNIPDTIAPALRKAEENLLFWEELAILGFTEAVRDRLEALNMSQQDLAAKLGVSCPYVTKLIGGSNNFTLRTMVKLARAVDSELNLDLRPAKAANEWRCVRSVVKSQRPIIVSLSDKGSQLPSEFQPTVIFSQYEDVAAAA